MKVVHLLPALEQGGVERVVCDLVRVAGREGWACVVVSRGGRLVDEVRRAGARHVALDVKSKNPLTYFLRAARLRRVLAAERPDLVCVHSRVPAWLFVWANRTLRLPWITYAHGANSVSRYSAVMTRGDRVAVPSVFLADYLRAHYAFDAAKLRVVRPAVDAARFDPARLDAAFVAEKRREWGLDGSFVVMALGRLSPVKGYETLLAAAPAEARVVLVGEADRRHRDYAQRLRARAGANVVFAGAQAKVAECLSLADVVVSSNTSKPESFGLSMAEALAMGKPVVARAFGGAREVVRDGRDGVLVAGTDPAAFAAALAQVRARAFVGLREGALARFGADVLADATRRLYAELAPGFAASELKGTETL